MEQLIFATHNAHKANEVKNIVGELFDVKNLSEINFFDEKKRKNNKTYKKRGNDSPSIKMRLFLPHQSTSEEKP